MRPPKQVSADDRIQVSADDSRLLREIVKTIGLDRRELCKLSKVSTGWLSLLLGAKGQPSKNVNADMITRLADVLVKQITNLPAHSSLPEERLKAALGFLSRYSDSAAKLMPPKIYTAGGPIPVDADHYIKRPQADGQILFALQAPVVSMLVRGPVQSGKSSLLAQLEHKARAKGIETAWFDPWATVSSVLDSGKQSEDVFALTAANLVKTLEAEWRLESSGGRDIAFKEDLFGWLFRALALADKKPRLLILDDLGGLGAKVTEEWLSFVRSIDTKRGSRGFQISVAVGMTHHLGPYYARTLEKVSSVVAWNPYIELDWFNDKQTAELERKLTGEEQGLYEIFRGQPYLTHAAARDKVFREAVELWTNAPTPENQPSVIGSLPYRSHLKAIRLALLGPPWQSQPRSRRLIDSFDELCRRSMGSGSPVSGLSTEDADKILLDEEFLKTAKLINEQGEPKLKIYSLIAEELKEQMNVRY